MLQRVVKVSGRNLEFAIVTRPGPLIKEADLGVRGGVAGGESPVGYGGERWLVLGASFERGVEG